jgi:hypothetical protein
MPMLCKIKNFMGNYRGNFRLTGRGPRPPTLASPGRHPKASNRNGWNIAQCVGSRTDGMPTVVQSDMRGSVTA